MRFFLTGLLTALLCVSAARADMLASSETYRRIAAAEPDELRRVRMQYCAARPLSYIMCELLLERTQTAELAPIRFLGDRLALALNTTTARPLQRAVNDTMHDWRTLLAVDTPTPLKAHIILLAPASAGEPVVMLTDGWGAELTARLSYHMQACADGVRDSCLNLRDVSELVHRSMGLIIRSNQPEYEARMWFAKQGWW